MGWKTALVVAIVATVVGGLILHAILRPESHSSSQDDGEVTTTETRPVRAVTTTSNPPESTVVTTAAPAVKTPTTHAPTSPVPRTVPLRGHDSIQSEYSGNWEDTRSQPTTLAYLTSDYLLWSEARENWIDFNLAARYAHFTATLGQTVNSTDRDGVLRFTVEVDGQPTLDKRLTFGQTLPVDVVVSGKTTLRLIVERVSGGTDSYGGFGDPRLNTT